MQNALETPEERNKVVLFRNFSDQVFSSVKPHKVNAGQQGGTMMIVDENCKWAGEDYTFEPGQSRYMPKWKAEHFARHLVNRELVRNGMENDTSPKRPKDNPRYMELFRKAVIEDPDQMPLSESKSEEEAMNLNKDAEIAQLRAENERLRNGGETPVTDKMEEMVPHDVAPEEIEPPVEAVLPKEKTELATPVDEDEADEQFEDPTDGAEIPQKPQGYAPGETPVPFNGIEKVPATGTGNGSTALNSGQ